jgi:hypothetical protein
VPALTGYIEKARWTELELRVKTAKSAVQTMITEQQTRDGGFTPHANSTSAPAGDFFDTITDNGGTFYSFSRFTTAGIEEFESLTGDTTSVEFSPTNPNHQWHYFAAHTDLSGAIKVFVYMQDSYTGEPESGLICVYFEDITSSDPATQARLNSYNAYTGMRATITNGFNIYYISWANAEYSFIKYA